MKVHFADLHVFRFSKALRDAGVNYLLQSYHPIKTAKKLKIDWDLIGEFKHVIFDSGLYTIMFGSGASESFSYEDALAWQKQYVEFLKTVPLSNFSFVDLDVQKKIGVDEAWSLRRELKKEKINGTMVTPYHLEDENPDKLIEFSEYIAVSIPELKWNVGKKEAEKITRYISSKATRKGKRVHLLGCTDKSFMRKFSYCFSCDSTSWASASRYGEARFDCIKGSRPISEIDDVKFHINGSETSRHTKLAKLAKMDYAKYAGGQS